MNLDAGEAGSLPELAHAIEKGQRNPGMFNTQLSLWHSLPVKAVHTCSAPVHAPNLLIG